MYYTTDNDLFYGPYDSDLGSFYLMIPTFDRGETMLLDQQTGEFEPFQRLDQTKDIFCFLEYPNGSLYWGGITPRPEALFDEVNTRTMDEWATLFSQTCIPGAFSGYDGTSILTPGTFTITFEGQYGFSEGAHFVRLDRQ